MFSVKIKPDGKLKIETIKNLDNENMAYMAIVLFYVWQTGNLFVQNCMGGNKLLVLGMYLFLAAGVGNSLLGVTRKNICYLLLSELTAVMLYLVSYIYGCAQTSTLLYNFGWTVAICLPIALNIVNISNMEQLQRLLYHMAKPMILILCVMIFLEFHVVRTSIGQYDMAASYALIFHCMVLCSAILEKVKVMDVAVLLAGLGTVLLRGSRGTYLCFAFFVVMKVLFDINSKKRKRYLLVCGAGVVIMGLLLMVIVQIRYANGVGNNLIRFYSLAKLLSGEMFRSDVRLQLYNYYFELILQKPVLGWGATGGWINAENYPHNIFLEIFLSFGVIPGAIVLLVMIFGVGYILKSGEKSERTLFLIYFSNAFSLMVSGTFLQNISFYFCIFLGIRCLKHRVYRGSTERAVDKVIVKNIRKGNGGN